LSRPRPHQPIKKPNRVHPRLRATRLGRRRRRFPRGPDMTSGDVSYLSHLIVDQLACALPIKVRAGCGQFLDECVWRPSVASAGCATGRARPLQARVYGVSVRTGGSFWIAFQDRRTRPLCEPSRPETLYRGSESLGFRCRLGSP
jgi:hypothetical protein